MKKIPSQLDEKLYVDKAIYTYSQPHHYDSFRVNQKQGC